MSLSDIEEFVVPFELVDTTLEPLQDAGSYGCEAFVLWGAHVVNAGHTLEFLSAYVPEQTTSRGEEGLLVNVSGEALFRVNRAFYREGLIIAAQVHSHPTAAYHSEIDDAYPLMTLVGGLSIVVPNFGREGRSGVKEWAWYRLAGPREWVRMAGGTMVTFR